MNRSSRETAIGILRAHERELRAVGVAGIYVFGSTARGEAKPDSDIDVLFDYLPTVRGLKVIGLCQAIQDLFEGPVDVVARNSVHPALKPHIEADAIRVF
ncbi:MAG TPA: nucleotidyltransferase family protein [Caulobacteraceae bacterium]|jgi:hypothetical protein|nr:nucleotidyltransferase family protein [Caulobacteraceae bacterium]